MAGDAPAGAPPRRGIGELRGRCGAAWQRHSPDHVGVVGCGAAAQRVCRSNAARAGAPLPVGRRAEQDYEDVRGAPQWRVTRPRARRPFACPPSAGDAGPTSDIDLLYELEPGARLGWNIETLTDELAEVIGRPVDLVSHRALNHRLRAIVLAEARPFSAPLGPSPRREAGDLRSSRRTRGS